jgi:UDP-N-acetyl-L-fucosamine synthase
MIKKIKIATVVGTRPEIIRLSRVLSKLDENCDHVIIHTGQNYDYELNEVFFNDLKIRKPDYFLNAAGKNAAETIGKVIIEVDRVLEKIKPDAILVLGDTNSCISVIPAKRRQIPIFHMEAGNRCFDQRVPEETNRRIVDHVADINLTYSTIARDYLIAEGISPDRVIKTGSPMFEVLSFYQKKIDSSNILVDLKLTKSKYFLVSCHREENINSTKQFKKFIYMLNSLADDYKIPVIVSTHPRTKKEISKIKLPFNKKILFMKPLGFFDYVNLQKSAKVVLSDSGTINEESSILNFPSLNIRDSHERPEGMEEGSVMMVGFNYDRIKQCIEILKSQKNGKNRLLRPVEDYQMPNVSDKVVRIIHSYIDYINKVVWKKY